MEICYCRQSKLWWLNTVYIFCRTHAVKTDNSSETIHWFSYPFSLSMFLLQLLKNAIQSEQILKSTSLRAIIQKYQQITQNCSSHRAAIRCQCQSVIMTRAKAKYCLHVWDANMMICPLLSLFLHSLFLFPSLYSLLT